MYGLKVMATQMKKATIGDAFGLILGAVVSLIMFIPRIIGLADKAVDLVEDTLDAGRALTTTMKESAEDFRNSSKAQADATFKNRIKDINTDREEAGLTPVAIDTARTLSPQAMEAIKQAQKASA